MTYFKSEVRSVIGCRFYRIMQFLQKCNQFFIAAVHVSDDIEWAVQFGFIVIQLFSDNRGNGIDFIFGLKDMNLFEAFFF